MKRHHAVSLSLQAALLLAFLPCSARSDAQILVRNTTSGPYAITLKLESVVSFSGRHPEMIRDSGAEILSPDSPEHPNHHLGIFVDKAGKTVLSAQVRIRYRQIRPMTSPWTTLPAVRIHHSATGPETTHFGNNLYLQTGSYEFEVTVNDSSPAILTLTLRH